MDYVYPPVSQARSILTIHDLAFAVHPATQAEEIAREMLERTRQAAQHASACICPSSASAQQVESLLDIDPARLHVIPFGVDHIPSELPLELVPEEPFLLSLGTIEPRKNHLRLLRAWRRLGKDRPLLVVIGREGWECDATVTELEAEEKAGRLRWLQNAEDSLVFAHLDRALALLYPSHLEGFGFPALEALALGTPVLAGNSPALREVLQDAALYCDPDSEEDIREQIQRILQVGSEGRERCHAGRKRASEFTWRACAERHMDLYREVLA
jgi:alpha-1,3-rhamnosyl/mannosyltransferase